NTRRVFALSDVYQRSGRRHPRRANRRWTRWQENHPGRQHEQDHSRCDVSHPNQDAAPGRAEPWHVGDLLGDEHQCSETLMITEITKTRRFDRDRAFVFFVRGLTQKRIEYWIF